MDEIVCANTAFRYWRCPPQVRDLYPRLPSTEDGWRALSQSPFVVDVLKTPIGSVEKVGVEPDPKRVGPASWNLEHG